MARRNDPKGRRGTPEEREAIAAKYQDAVAQLQRTAYWNLRSTIASVCVFLGVFAILFIAWGEADGARLVPTLACAIGGVCGAGVYFSRPYPLLVRWLLLAAVSFTALGLAGLAIVAGTSS
ncbi:hypothetical protein [Actinoplanes aureus]|uniref:Uncharacterized protein n=1 Tax=Actinoplanes aureus TaxID=2792083 RepID=A0A931CJS4_9ACTN|nr:hypothetical protein [Actinoplanes aureus]MBG0567701.1 hypothetical protein [Actinoplanes aureus]